MNLVFTIDFNGLEALFLHAKKDFDFESGITGPLFQIISNPPIEISDSSFLSSISSLCSSIFRTRSVSSISLHFNS